MDLVGHHEIAGAEAGKVDQKHPVGARRTRYRLVGLGHSFGRPRATEITRQRAHQHPVAATPEPLQRPIEFLLVRGQVPVDTADVVDADVQTADVVNRTGLGGTALQARNLLCQHIGGTCPVDSEIGEGHPEPPGQPLRPGLKRHAPLQLSAAVGYRVAESQHSEADRWRHRTHAGTHAGI